MKTLLLISLQVLTALGFSVARDLDSAPIFALSRTADGYNLNRLNVARNDSLLIYPDSIGGFIDIILPVGPGGSGNILKANSLECIKVGFDGGVVNCEYKNKNGKVINSPPRELSGLQKYDTHVSVTGADGSIAAFIIKNYDNSYVDSTGPVLDMFRGMMPMNPGDYSLFLNTESNRRTYELEGEIPVFYSGKYLFAEATAPDGSRGLFAVDIGATVSVVAESFLSDDLEILESYMLEYSSGQKRQLKYISSGGTGPIETIIGQATLPYLDIGSLHYENVAVDVIKSLPELHGRKIDGIIGLNLLRAARYLTLIYDLNDSLGSKLIFSHETPTVPKALQLPFVSIRGLMYVRGQIKNRNVCFVLDSGSPDCMLTTTGANQLQINLENSDTLSFKGGGGQVEKGQRGTIESVTLKNFAVKELPCVIGNLFNLSSIGQGQIGGMLGNSLFARFNYMTLDFDSQTLYLGH